MRMQARFGSFFRPSSAVLVGGMLGLFLWFSGCTSRQIRPTSNPLEGSIAPGRISIMAYNVENFFDELHDADHEDYPFLPLAEKKRNPDVKDYCGSQPSFRQKECFKQDWSADVVKKKIKAVASSIKQVYGQGPDILIMEEVENLRMLKRLNDEGLGGTYKTVVWLPGRDKRGIAVGMMSRFPLAGEPKLHQMAFRPVGDEEDGFKDTRGILEIPLKLPNGQTISVFGVHLPSQMNPVSEREDSVNGLRELLKKKGPNDLWVVGGDWNITYREDQETGLIKDKMAEVGLVSHIVGCQNCAGTHFYHGDWDFLDILVFSKNFAPEAKGPYQLVVDSIQPLMWGPGQTQANGRPIRFDLKKRDGVSDHLPIYAEIKSADAK